uniref:Uncharacterized protein n=1 Tax=Arundo donax TaxID=35708 RepID=A0A0A9H9K0_ARUDO
MDYILSQTLTSYPFLSSPPLALARAASDSSFFLFQSEEATTELARAS